ncbi:non-ribosomal peptide synthetase [Paenibacillus sp. BJ-4]|uniref:non-ribosomal peptide synthetase n=1 Tax=Paenibacillus sp. BJ-4 TaxID=2878097 RepID=UPI001CF0076B|nr:amino acid adenylation domain-containing protein [Paenibacillus sp. BJ-4]
MSEGSSTIIERLGHKLDKCLDGNFELYKNGTVNSNCKRYANYQHILNLNSKNNISEHVNPPTFFFGVFMSLMMRYTQNELLTGVFLRNFTDNLSVLVATVQYDDQLTMNDVIKQISREKEALLFKHNSLDAVLLKTASYANAVFSYTDFFDSSVNVDQRNVQTDICFQVVAADEKTILNIIYNENTYDKDLIFRMALHYDQLLSCVLADFELPICNVTYLSTAEEKLLVDVWNRTDYPFPSGYCIHQLFEQRVREAPDVIAVYHEGKTMTRGMLNKRANQLAHQLLQLGVNTGDIITLYTNKSINFVIGIMGILKAGCAYLPIDASYPQSRVEYILANSKSSVAVTTIDLGNNPAVMSGLRVVKMDSEDDTLVDYPDTNPNISVGPHDPCYLIYTSGSTGQPKGVLLNHEGRVNNFYDFNSRFSITSKDKVLAVSSVSFDMSAYDILGSMIIGSSVVLPDPLLEKQTFHWLDLIQKYNVTIWHSVPVLLHLLCKCCQHRESHKLDSIRLVLLGGDWIPLSLPDSFRLLNNQAVLVSLGGATEVSMDSTIYPIHNVNPDWKSIPYGKPMRNQKAYVLDKNRQLQPIGFPGELYLGGIGVGDGYYLNPEATREHFFENPWVDDPKQRIYKTGDLALFEPDGTLILLGRIDFQVKINGTRIELGEIEHCLLNYEGISRSVAVAPKVGSNRKIVVHVEYKSKLRMPKESEIFEYLSTMLPKSHIPAHIILTNAIPITPNGKIDRKALEKLTDNFLSQSKL